MTTHYLKTLCIQMPIEFPASEFTAFMAHTGAVLVRKGSAQIELGGTPNIIGYRFRHAWESLNVFSESWDEFGDASATHEELYKRDRALFEFFSAGVSCIEATCYAIYAVASDPNTLGLPFGPKEQKKAYPRDVRDALKKAQPTSKVTGLIVALDAMLAAPEWDTWMSFRNRMNHRSNLPRRLVCDGSGAVPATPPIHLGPTSSTKAFSGDVADLRGLLAWLAETQRALLVAGTAL